MNHRIIVQQPKDDTLGSSILKLLEVLRQLDNVQLGDTIVIDITKISFATPVLILPLSSIIANLQNSGHDVTIQGGSSYLQTVLFPNGFNALDRENWADSLNYYRTGTYLPICQIPAGESETGIRDRLLTVFGSIMLQQLNITGQLLTAIRYLISETMDNIVEHARVSNLNWIY